VVSEGAARRRKRRARPCRRSRVPVEKGRRSALHRL